MKGKLGEREREKGRGLFITLDIGYKVLHCISMTRNLDICGDVVE